MRAFNQYFVCMLSRMLYKVVLTSKSTFLLLLWDYWFIICSQICTLGGSVQNQMGTLPTDSIPSFGLLFTTKLHNISLCKLSNN